MDGKSGRVLRLSGGRPIATPAYADGMLFVGGGYGSHEFCSVDADTGKIVWKIQTGDEYRLFVALAYDFAGNPILNSTDYVAAVTALWGAGLEPSVVALYPFASYSFGGEVLGASGTDGIFSCPARNANQLLSKFVTTYAHEFNDENAPPSQSSFGGLLTFPLGAYHTAELQYLFKSANFFGLSVALLSPEQVRLSEAMINYWTRFAKTGDPNSFREPVWFPYSASRDEFQSLIPPTPMVESNFDAIHQCSTFWDTF